MVVPEQVQQPVHERASPLVAGDVRAHDDITELPRQTLRERLATVEREREDVRGLVDAEVLALQRPALRRPDEGDAELTRSDTLLRKHAAGQLDGSALVDLAAAAVLDLDRDHRGPRGMRSISWGRV